MLLYELLQQLVSSSPPDGGIEINPIQAAFARYPSIAVGDFVRLISEAVVELQQRQLQRGETNNNNSASARNGSSTSSSDQDVCAIGGSSLSAAMTTLDMFDYSPFKFLALKKQLFVAHGMMDADGDGLITHEDFVDYLLDSRKKQLGEVLGETPCFEIAQTMPFRIPRGGSDVDSSSSSSFRRRNNSASISTPLRSLFSRPSSADPDDDADDSTLMQFDPITNLRSVAGGRKLFAIGRMHRSGFISPEGHTVVSELAQPPTSAGGALSLGGLLAVKWPTSRVIDADLLSLVTCHRDRAVVLWKEKALDAPSIPSSASSPSSSTMPRLWNPFYNFSCECVQTAIAAHPLNDIVFTGGMRGDMKMWHLSTDLIADFSRGERTALAKISARCWGPGERHNGSITGIAYLRQGHRVVSCSMDATVAEYDVEKEHVVKRYVHTSGVQMIKASVHLQDFVVGCGFGPSPCLWDVNASGDKPILLADFADPHRQSLVAVTEIPGSTPLLASCDATSKVKIWDLRMMTCLQTIVVDRDGLVESTKSTSGGGNGSAVTRLPLATSMAATKSGQLIVTGRNYNVLESSSLQVSSRQQMRSTTGSVFDSSSDSLLTLHPDCVVRWESGAPRSSYRFLKTHRSGSNLPLCIALDPRGRNFLVGWSDGSVKAFKISTGEFVESFSVLKCEVRCVIGTVPTAHQAAAASSSSSSPWYFAAIGNDGLVGCVVDKLSRPKLVPIGGMSSATCGGTHGSTLVIGTAEGEVMGIAVTSTGPSEGGPAFLFRLEESESITALDIVRSLGLAVAGTSGGSFVVINLHKAGELLREIQPPSKAPLPRAPSASTLSRTATAMNLDGSTGPSPTLGASRPTPISSIAVVDSGKGSSWRVVCGLEDGQLVVFKIERTIVSDDLMTRNEADRVIVHHAGLGAILRDAVVALSPAGSIVFACAADGSSAILDSDGTCLGALSMTRKEPLTLTTNIRLAQAKDRAVVDHIHTFLAALKRKVVLKSLANRHHSEGLMFAVQSSARLLSNLPPGHRGGGGSGALVTPCLNAEAAAGNASPRLAAGGQLPSGGGSNESGDRTSSQLHFFTAAARRISAQQQQQQMPQQLHSRRETMDDNDLHAVLAGTPRAHNPILKVQPPPRPVTASARGNLPIRLDGPQPLVPSRDITIASRMVPTVARPSSATAVAASAAQRHFYGPQLGRSSHAQSSGTLQQQSQLVVLGETNGGARGECSVRGLVTALEEKFQRDEDSKASKLTPRRPMTARR